MTEVAVTPADIPEARSPAEAQELTRLILQNELSGFVLLRPSTSLPTTHSCLTTIYLK